MTVYECGNLYLVVGFCNVLSHFSYVCEILKLVEIVVMWMIHNLSFVKISFSVQIFNVWVVQENIHNCRPQ